MSELSREDAAYVAALARLDLSKAELDLFAGQLSSVLAHVNSLARLDTSGVPPTSHPLPLENVLRPDTIGECLDRDEVLSAAPEVEDGRFRVPRILGEAP